MPTDMLVQFAIDKASSAGIEVIIAAVLLYLVNRRIDTFVGLYADIKTKIEAVLAMVANAQGYVDDITTRVETFAIDIEKALDDGRIDQEEASVVLDILGKLKK